MEPDKQIPKQLEPYIFKPGKSGNPKGRPKGPTLKEWARQQLMKMNDEERIEFLKRLPAEVIWKMAEGNPHSTQDTTVEGEITVSGVDVAVRK